MSNKTYDVLKWVASVVLPAFATLTLTIGQIWGWSDWTVPIGATISAVATFMGAILGISSIAYNKAKGGDK